MDFKKILIVEDNLNQSKSLFDIIRAKGYKPEVAVNAGEALSKMEIETPVVALIDLKLGNESGLEVIRAIKERSPHTECIVLTGHVSHSSAIEAIDLGAYSYLQKPYEMGQLLLTIERAIEKQLTEKARRAAEEKFTVAFRSNPGAVSISALADERFIDVNDGFLSLSGYKRHEVAEQTCEELGFWAVSEQHRKFIEELQNLGIVNNFEITFRCKNGELRTGLISAETIHLNQKSCILSVIIDITQRRRAEEALRELAAHQESVREEERTRIAREIHDDLGQTLTALKMDLSWMVKKIPASQQALLEKTNIMIGLTSNLIKSVQKISADLRPGLLDDLGLAAAIDWEIKAFQERTAINCSYAFHPEQIELDREHTTALYRIFLEALTNIARHAGASRLEVLLAAGKEWLNLTIRDNGIGIAEEQISSNRAYGLIGMRERVQRLDGEFYIHGTPEKGTEIEIKIPIKSPGKQALN